MAGQIADSKQLQIQIAASTELLIRNLKTADQAVAAFQAGTNRSLTLIDARFAQLGAPLASLKATLGGLSSGLVGGLAAAAGGASLISLAKNGLEYASSLQEVSQQLGVTSTDLQVFRYAASQVGVSQEEMERGLQKLTQTMGKAELGAKEPAKAFEALGISIRSLNGQTAGDVIPRIADGLAKVGDPAQRAAIEIALFGKAGQQLDPLLSQGASGIAQFEEQARKLGLVLSSKEIQDADNAADKLAEVKKVLEANIAKTVADNAGAILTLAEAFERAATSAARFVQRITGAARITRDEGLKQLSPQEVTESGTTDGYAQRRLRLFRGAIADSRAAKARRDQLGPDASTTDRQAADLDLAKARKVVVEQYKLYVPAAKAFNEERGATALARAQIVSGKGTAPQFLAPASAAPKGKSAEQLADEQARNDKAYTSDEARAQEQLAAVRADLAGTADARLAVELARVDTAKQARDKEIADTSLTNRTYAANADHLRELNAQTAEAQKQVLIARRDTQAAQDALSIRLVGYDREEQTAQLQEDLAQTTAQRRDAEKRLLAIQIKAERDRLGTDKASAERNGDKAGADLAQARIDGLGDRLSAGNARIDKDTQSPLASYKDQLTRAVGDTNEALEGVKVDAFRGLEDELTGVISGTESVASAFKKMADTIIADIARIVIEQTILGAIGGSAGGGLLSGVSRLFGGHRAGGGPVDPSRAYVVGEKGEEVFVPNTAGRIIPNHALRAPSLGRVSGSGRPTVLQQFTYQGNLITEKVYDDMQAIAAQAGQQAFRGSVDHTNDMFRVASRSGL